MSVRVICNSCNTASEVTEEAVGREAVCPACDAVFQVTEGVMAERKLTPPKMMGPFARYLVDQEPLTDETLQHGRLDPTLCVRIAIEILRRQLPTLFFCHMLFFACVVLFSSAVQVATDSGLGDLGIVFRLFSLPILMFVKIGLTVVTLYACRAQPIELNLLVSGGKKLFRFVAFNMILLIICGAASLAFIVPGIYLALKFWAGGFLIVDRDCSLMEAFGLAGKLSESNKAATLQLAIFSCCIGILGMAFFGVGVIISFPIINMMWTVAYMMMARLEIQRPTEIAH